MAVEITVEGIPRGEIERAVARLFRKSTMNLYGRSVRARTRERMIEEVDPDGTPWAPLSEPYGSRKKGPGKLRETLALFKTMHVEAQDGAAQVGTRLDYGTWNQEGSDETNLPARPWLGVTDQDITDIEVIANGIWESSF